MTPPTCQAIGCDQPADWVFIYGEQIDLALCDRHGGTERDIPGWIRIPPTRLGWTTWGNEALHGVG